MINLNFNFSYLILTMEKPEEGDFSHNKNGSEELQIVYDTINRYNLWEWIKTYDGDKSDENYKKIISDDKIKNNKSVLNMIDKLILVMINIANNGWDKYISEVSLCVARLRRKQKEQEDIQKYCSCTFNFKG